jgi:hypothetical protein
MIAPAINPRRRPRSIVVKMGDIVSLDLKRGA